MPCSFSVCHIPPSSGWALTGTIYQWKINEWKVIAMIRWTKSVCVCHTYLQVVCLTDVQFQIKVVRSVFLPKLNDKHRHSICFSFHFICDSLHVLWFDCTIFLHTLCFTSMRFKSTGATVTSPLLTCGLLRFLTSDLPLHFKHLK